MAKCFYEKIIASPHLDGLPLLVPCGKCIACKINHAAEWGRRCLDETQAHKYNSFLTLTYAPKYLPTNEKGAHPLIKKDIQNFLKRLRIAYDRGKVTTKLEGYFLCGEYGTKKHRPHYHILAFGYCPNDLQIYRYSYSGYPIYTSPSLTNIWGKGWVYVGTNCTKAAAAYVARYCTKKISDKYAQQNGLIVDFQLSSKAIIRSHDRKSAIGGEWLYNNQITALRGWLNDINQPNIKNPLPTYYKKLLKKYNQEEYAKMALRQIEKAIERIRNHELHKMEIEDLKRQIEYQNRRIRTLERNFDNFE